MVAFLYKICISRKNNPEYCPTLGIVAEYPRLYTLHPTPLTSQLSTLNSQQRSTLNSQHSTN